jgi:hypothetical protein
VNHFEEGNAVLGGAGSCPLVRHEELGFHLLRGVLHHQIVNFLGVLGPPSLLVISMIVFLLPLHCLDEGGCVRWVIGELNRRFFELADCKRGEGSVVFQAVHEVLGDSFNVQVEGGCRLDSPHDVKYDVFKTLCG